MVMFNLLIEVLFSTMVRFYKNNLTLSHTLDFIRSYFLSRESAQTLYSRLTCLNVHLHNPGQVDVHGLCHKRQTNMMFCDMSQ